MDCYDSWPGYTSDEDKNIKESILKEILPISNGKISSIQKNYACFYEKSPEDVDVDFEFMNKVQVMVHVFQQRQHLQGMEME